MRIAIFVAAVAATAGCAATSADSGRGSVPAAAVALSHYGSTISLWDAAGNRIQTSVTGVTDPVPVRGGLSAPPAGTRWAAAELRLADAGPGTFDGQVTCQVLTGGTPVSSTTSGIRHPQGSESVGAGGTLSGRLMFAVPSRSSVIGVTCTLPAGDTGTWWP